MDQLGNTNFLLQFWYQSVLLVTRWVCELLLPSKFRHHRNNLHCTNHTHCVFLLLLRMRELCPMQSCPAMSENDQLQSREIVFYIAFVVRYSMTNSSEILYSSYLSSLFTASLQVNKLEFAYLWWSSDFNLHWKAILYLSLSILWLFEAYYLSWRYMQTLI